MATGILFYDPRSKPTASNGNFMPFCYRFFYLTGTTTIANVYEDEALTTPLAQPLLSGADGRFPNIYMDPNVIYRCQLYSPGTSLGSGGILLDDTDPFGPPESGVIGGVNVPWTPAIIFGAGGVANYTQQSGIYSQIGNVIYYSLVMTGSRGTGSGSISIVGLPQSLGTSAFSTFNNPSACYCSGVTHANSNTEYFLLPAAGGTPFGITMLEGGAVSDLVQASQLSASAFTIQGGGFFFLVPS